MFSFPIQPPKPPHPLLDSRRLLDGATPDFRACWLAGVEMKTTSEKTDTGYLVTMSTVRPCAVQTIAGRTYVFEGPK